MSVSSSHTSKLCCVVRSIGKLYDKDICKQCLKDIVKTEAIKEDTFPDILAILNAFTIHDKT